MLARAASDAGTRLRRSKSTSSTAHRQIPPIPEALDPDVAQQHALVAATTAFARAQQATALEPPEKPSSNLARTKSTSSRKSLSSQGSHFPPRGSSFRSMNPSQRQQKSNVQRQSKSTLPTEKFPPFDPIATTERPLSAQLSVIMNENMRPGSQQNSHRRSAASSITSQQIRKARSMYYASSVQTGSPIARPPVRYLISPPLTSMESGPGPGPTTHNRPLTPLPLASSQIPVQIEPGETIDKARDRYLQTFQQRQTKHKPSLFLAPFRKRQDKAKPKERPASTGLISVSSTWRQTPNDTMLESLDDFGMPRQKKEKRSISGSIKDKLKKVFRRTSNTAITLPVQQVDASRNYSDYTSVQREQSHVAEGSSSIPSPDNGTLTLTQIRSATPALERAPSPFIRPVSRNSNTSGGSNRSLHSEQNLTHTSSRVTSWSDSSASGTLTQREIKRLTVIHEAKDSIGSEADCASVSPSRRNTVPLPSSSALTQPMQLEKLLEKSSTPVDPKRVFSALMKEIDASKAAQAPVTKSDDSPGAESDIFESSATKELHVVAPREVHSSGSKSFRPSVSSDRYQRPCTARSKSSSIRSFGKVLRSTIRTVTPSERKVSTNLERTGSVRGAVRVPRPSTDTSSSGSNISETGRDKGNDRTIGSANIRLHPPQESSPSTEQIERRIAKSRDRWKAQLDEHMPKHMAYRDTSYETTRYVGQTTATPPKPTETPSSLEFKDASPAVNKEQVTPVYASQKSPGPREILSPLSPSVYSRNTDGLSILPNDSILSFEETKEGRVAQEGGSAVVMASHSVRSYAIGTPSPQRVSDSTHSSRDWKAWLSHEVSELATESREDIAINESYITPTGHRRELTQIDDDSMTVGRKSMDIPTPRQEHIRIAPVDTPPKPTAASAKQTELPVEDTSAPATPGTPKAKRNVLTIKMTPIPNTNRLSSVNNKTLSASPSTEGGTPRSSRMNERFPFIATGRRSSSYSAKLRRMSRTSTGGSSGSSSKSKTATPSSKIYTDYSAPGSNRTILHESQVNVKGEDFAGNQKLSKENVTPTSSSNLQFGDRAQIPKIQFSPSSISRPRSMLPLTSSAMNHGPSIAAKYTVNATEPSKASPLSTPAISPLRQRSKVALRPSSPEKTVVRPKSAVDLRSTKIPAPLTTRGSKLLPMIGTSTLALNKEPSPGVEERIIDSLIEYEVKPLDHAGTGRITPGQRMAEQFLRERSVGRGSEAESENMTIGDASLKSEGRGGGKVDREDTPAFL
ncbi:hypothetical protein DM02DRAFT_598524 [Periconia macrospinosa]|uniref:Uncharacterized protein n=1 Tax=Periconia macrospinosa TaxID=97972 RepID=A0A2V1DFE8_9PLEO|nr:hypothetical protein DM02DRAFT_598524 [Periconia macrospinosa]